MGIYLGNAPNLSQHKSVPLIVEWDIPIEDPPRFHNAREQDIHYWARREAVRELDAFLADEPYTQQPYNDPWAK